MGRSPSWGGLSMNRPASSGLQLKRTLGSNCMSSSTKSDSMLSRVRTTLLAPEATADTVMRTGLGLVTAALRMATLASVLRSCAAQNSSRPLGSKHRLMTSLFGARWRSSCSL